MKKNNLVECFKCGASNPGGQKHCGSCGAELDPASDPVQAYLEQHLRSQVRSVLREELKDRDVVEIKVTQAVASKLTEWAKILAFFVGVPLALVAITLGMLGIRTYTDFRVKTESLKAEITGDFGRAKKDSVVLVKELERLRAKLNRSRALLTEVETLTGRVERIETKVGLADSKDLGPELRKNVEESFRDFIGYLEGLGFRGEPVVVKVDESAKGNAFYDEASKTIFITPAFANDRQVIYFTYTSYALSSLKGNVSPQELEILYGLADYFTCSFSNKPIFGEVAVREMRKARPGYHARPYFRNLSNDRRLIRKEGNSVDWEAVEAWGGVFWDLRYLLGPKTADELLYTTWVEFGKSPQEGDSYSAFARLVIDRSKMLGGGIHTKDVRSFFERRGQNTDSSSP